MTVSEEKAGLRRRIRAVRQLLPADKRLAFGAAALALLSASPLWQNAGSVMAYAAFHGEPDLQCVLEAALAEGKRLLMPRCEEERRLSVRRIERLSDLVPRTCGIAEPADHCPEEAPDGILLIPGLAFDRFGHRLGQGGGYYDRFLPGTSAVRIGVCYASELMEAIPAERFDACMDYLLTEKALIRVKGDCQ